MSLDPSMLANLTPEELAQLLAGAAAANPDAFKQAISESADVKRLAKQAVGTGGSSRTPSFLEPIWPVVLTSDAVLAQFGVERGENDDATLTAVLAAIDGKVEGSQEACTLQYESGGRVHKVRFTVLSEDNSAEGTLNKALEQVEKAAADKFNAVAEKYRKRVRAGRVDEETRKEHLARFDAAVAARKAKLEGSKSAPKPPPVPPTASE